MKYSITQTAINELLNIEMVSYPHCDSEESNSLIVQNRDEPKPSFHNARSFLKKIDSLPETPAWSWETLMIKGDLLDDKGKPQNEEADVWMRDPVECIRELIGNLLFKDSIKYASYRVFNKMNNNGEGRNRGWDEAATADEWWDLQVHSPFLHGYK
jgi:hypothetical protein